MAEDVVFQSGEGMFYGRSSEPHGLRGGPLVHSLQGVVVKMAANGSPGSCGALAFERAARAVFGRGGIEDAGFCYVAVMARERCAVRAAEGIGCLVVQELAAVQKLTVGLIVNPALGRNVRQDAMLLAAL